MRQRKKGCKRKYKDLEWCRGMENTAGHNELGTNWKGGEGTSME